VTTESTRKVPTKRPTPAPADPAPVSPATAVPVETDAASTGSDQWWERMRTQLQSRPQDGPTAGAPTKDRRRAVAVLLVATTVIGLVLGFLLGGRVAKTVATAQVDAGPGSTSSQQLSVSPDQANRYAQTQVLFISDPATATAVQASLGLDAPPSYTVRQVGTTSVLEIAAQNSDATAAADVANAVARTYVAGWRARNTAELDKQLAEIDDQLATVAKQVDALSGSRLTPAQQARLTALTAQSQQLLAQQGTLQSDSAAVAADDRIVTIADPAFATTSPSTKLTALLGALVGFLAGVGIVAWSRRRP
jgi:uncharacterized protein involved in exopolysaccharide biosynthesis